MKFQPLQRSSLYLEIARQVEELIMSGELPPGKQLPTERKLAEMFSVSRTTVRQALAALEAKGLISSQIGSGTFTRERSAMFATAQLAHILDNERLELDEALEARSILEPAIARLAAERATEESISVIGAQLTKMEQADGEHVTFYDSEFHLSIGAAAGNRILQTVLDAVTEATRSSRGWALSDPKDRRSSLADHHRIYAAIVEHDGNAAFEAMSRHIDNIRQLAEEQLTKRTGAEAEAVVGAPEAEPAVSAEID